MNSLKKGEGVPLLNFEGGPGILLLNFEGVQVPGPRVLVPLLHHAFTQFVFIVCQVEDYQNIMKLNCRPPALTSHGTF